MRQSYLRCMIRESIEESCFERAPAFHISPESLLHLREVNIYYLFLALLDRDLGIIHDQTLGFLDTAMLETVLHSSGEFVVHVCT